MKILVVGTGALACLFAARLGEAGNEVSMLGSWPDGLAALRLQGVRLLALDGSSQQVRVSVLDGASSLGSYLNSLVLVKSWQTGRAADQLKGLLSKNGIALTLQNGFGNLQTLQQALGLARVALGVTTLGARLIEPGYVQHTGDGKVMVGSHPRLGELGEALSGAGFSVEQIADPETLLWGKLVINAAINPLTALMRITNGELLTKPESRQLMAETTREAAAVAARMGVLLPYEDAIMAVEEVARNTGANTSSMLQDVLRGRPTEIEAINGAIVRFGEKAGVPTPVNRVLWQLVKSIEHH
jgi:2-dehydropantoate 2-reductase